MTYQTYTPWSQGETPKSITLLIAVTALATLCCTALEPLFINVFKMNGPLEFFGLSWWGLSNFYLWQPITNLFIQNNAGGINLSFLIALTFNMYLLWLFGSNLIETYGTGPFLRLYFLSGILASLVALITVPYIRQYMVIAGMGASLLAIFVAWAILHRDTQLLLFFLIPIKAKWLLAAVLGIALLIPISELDFQSFFYYLTGILIGYLYSTLAWQSSSPFEFMEKIDVFLVSLGRKARVKLPWFSKKSPKIVDINTGKAPLDDDAFMDAMLAKIARKGEKSLSWQERDRMRKISEKKMRSQK